MIKKSKQNLYNFLRWTEKWTKTDMIYLTKGGSLLFIARIIASFLAFVISIAFAKYISKNQVSDGSGSGTGAEPAARAIIIHTHKSIATARTGFPKRMIVPPSKDEMNGLF